MEKNVIDTSLICSFCNTSEKDVDFLVEGENAYICDSCVARASDIVKENSKQLVGILPLNKAENIEEGQHIIESETLSTPIRKPVKMLGHITSSYYSPTLDHCVAMALIKGGHKLIGGKAFVSTPNLKTIPVHIVKPAFVDPKNEKLLS